MSTVPTTPRRHATIDPNTSTPAATPHTSRVATSVLQSSPHYTTTRRHSLYGTEDRIIIDPGSRIWKVGFSGEGKPRDVFVARRKEGGTLWNLNRAATGPDREEEDRLLEARLQDCLRAVFHDSLLTDPKSRKVILIEHPLLPIHVKEKMARILFNNLQVPSVSFASSPLLSLLAAGRLTGLVLDCGHLESTVLPIYGARPLFPQLQTTPLAGARLSYHLRALLLLFGTYLPPPTSLSAAANIPASTRSTRVPEEVLTESVIEELKTRICFVSEPLDTSELHDPQATSGGDEASEMDIPPSSDTGMSESSFTHISGELESNQSSQQAPSSGFSVVSHSHAPSNLDRPQPGESHLQALAKMYMRHSTATDLRVRVEPPPNQQTGTGRGTLIVPGWIRERAAEVLFEGGDVDEASVAEVILESLLKAPVDLRKTLAANILVVGGTPMMPGFIPRLQSELLRAVSPRNHDQDTYDGLTPMGSPTRHGNRRSRPKSTGHGRYSALKSLIPYFAIMNHPSPPPPQTARAAVSAGKAPAFAPAAMAWVGGSLAGALKTGGIEITREKWDEADAAQPDSGDDLANIVEQKSIHSLLPDWTRSPLPAGAPPAPRPPPPQPIAPASPQTAVGA
ncbi:actin-domain-containing protein [Panus rudis PR-1116 ss-1]|nr:actin-domain-containing protein [Panus rudis PR-1116 ss-1]